MAALNFNALEFDSQQIPEPLPEAPLDPEVQALTEFERSFLNTSSGFGVIGFIDTPAKAKYHCTLLKEERARQAAQQAREQAKAERTDPVARAARAQARSERLTVVNAANLAWREAVAERTRIVGELDAKVAALRMEFKRLRDANA